MTTNAEKYCSERSAVSTFSKLASRQIDNTTTSENRWTVLFTVRRLRQDAASMPDFPPTATLSDSPRGPYRMIVKSSDPPFVRSTRRNGSVTKRALKRGVSMRAYVCYVCSSGSALARVRGCVRLCGRVGCVGHVPLRPSVFPKILFN